MNRSLKHSPNIIADALHAVRHVFVRDLEIVAILGVHEHEKAAPQNVLVNVDLTVGEAGIGLDDDLANVVCYEDVVNGIKEIASSGHVNLVETLAERIAQHCLADARVLAVRVRIEKPDVIPEAASVGVEIERIQSVG